MVFVPLMIAIAVGLALWLRPWPLFLAPDEPGDRGAETSSRNVAREFGKWVERQARARGLNVRGVARAVPIECPKCGQKGVVTWEENKYISVDGPEPTLIRLSSEFYERVSKKAPHVIELVCRKCGTAQTE